MLERQRGQHLQAEVVAHEVFEGDGRTGAGPDVQRQGARGEPAVVGVGVHLVDADGHGPVAGGLVEGRRGGEDTGHGQGKEGEGGAGHRRTCAVWRVAPCCALPYGPALTAVKPGPPSRGPAKMGVLRVPPTLAAARGDTESAWPWRSR